MQTVHAENRVDVQLDNPRPYSVQIDPPRGRARHRDTGRVGVRDQRTGKDRSRHVLKHIAVLRHGHNHLIDPRAQHHPYIRRRQNPPLFQVQIIHAQRMRQNAADGFADRNRTKPHQPCLRVAVICAMMATAISAGDFDPMFRPTGALIRAMSASENPATVRRSTRLAWVRVDPRHPR